MKKVFNLTAPNKKYDRQVEAVKYEVNKYLARERRKALPPDTDFWDFDCKVGADANTAQIAHVAEIGKKIDQLAVTEAPSFYIEILAKPATRKKREPTIRAASSTK